MTIPAAPAASSPAARAVMRGNRRRDTGPEVALRRALHAAGLRYRVDHPIRVDGQRPIRADVVFARPKVAVFVDGCFWHACPEHRARPKSNGAWWAQKLDLNVVRDRRDDVRMRQAGWTVVRIWEHEDVAAATDRVIACLAEVERDPSFALGGPPLAGPAHRNR